MMADTSDTPFEPLKIRYNMSPQELQQSASLFLQERPPRDASHFVCYRIEHDDPYANIGRTVESAVFFESFGNDVEVMADTYGPYERASVFFVVFDAERRMPVGVLRVITYSSAGLMTLNDLAKGQCMRDATSGQPVSVSADTVMRFHSDAARGRTFDTLDDCWDVGTIAVLPEYRASKNGQESPSFQLYRALYLSAISEDIKHFTSVIDSGVLRQMKHFLGVPFHPLAGTPLVCYLGSPRSQAVYGYVPEFYEVMSRHRETPTGHMAGPVLDRLNGAHGMDETLQFLTLE